MKRREAIRNLSLGIGYVVSAPAVLGVLQSCSGRESSPQWEAVFFNEDQQHLSTHLVDIILPSSEIPGGLDLNLPQFVDRMCSDLLTETDKQWFQRGSQLFAGDLLESSGKEVSHSGKKDVLKVFEKHFKVPEGRKQEILRRQAIGAMDLSEAEQDSYALYRFLFVVREFALLGYFTSEEIGKEVLVFDPIPGGFRPCIPLSEVGNAWTIDP